ncbi:hypothetical protein ONJ17_25915, partial [Salmonella enterica subsp. enterica serovar Agona]|nr:hypothetical protein [Salmonella enterica subsp. enterica serovar Agona]
LSGKAVFASLPYPALVISLFFTTMVIQLCNGSISPILALFIKPPVFQSRMPQPYIKLNPADAAKLGVNAGTRVSFSYDGNTVTLP